MGWLGFWSQIVACGTALISGHVADKLIGHFKMVLLILLSISTFSFIWMCFICTQVIPFSIGKYLPSPYVPEFFSSCLTSNNIDERNYMHNETRRLIIFSFFSPIVCFCYLGICNQLRLHAIIFRACLRSSLSSW